MGYIGIIKAHGEDEEVNKFVEDIKPILESAKEYGKDFLDKYGYQDCRIFEITEPRHEPFNVRMPSAMNPNVVIEYAYIKDDGSMAKEVWEEGQIFIPLVSKGSKQGLLRIIMFGYDQLADEENTED